MIDRRLEVKDIRKARVRYYEKDMKGCEIPNIDAYAFFVKVNGVYINPVRPFDEFNVYDRLPYPNSSRDGEDYGSMIMFASGKNEDGMCYVLESKSEPIFGHPDSISIRELEEGIISDIGVFYMDRWDLVANRPSLSPLRKRIERIDSGRRKMLFEFLEAKEKEVKERNKKDKVLVK